MEDAGGGPNAGLDIQKLPETKTGIKLRQRLLMDPKIKTLVDNIGEKPNLKDMDLEYRSILLSTTELFKTIDMSTGIEQTVFLYTIFNILDNVLNYPYSDDQRILYLSRYKSRIFKMDPTLRFLKTLGFEPSSSAETLCLPYEKPLSLMLIAREALINRVQSKVDNAQMSDIDAKMGFPTFQKYASVFGCDLTDKTAKVERDSLMLGQDETVKLEVESECKMLEEYIVELGENSHEFQMAFIDILGKGQKAKGKDILMIIRELWLETNVLHKTAVFLRQCFGDPVSKASLTDAKDKNSKFARGVIGIDIMEALGLKKGTGGRVTNIEQLVMMFCERETYRIQNFDANVY